MFGLGMSFTVAPLTAAVMGSVDDHYSGAASGVNNAMTRIANVFANAIFGALAVVFFSAALQKDMAHSQLSVKQQQLIIATAANLGDAKVPNEVSGADKKQVQIFLHNSFISAYSKVLRISSALAFVAALMAAIFIRDKKLAE